MADSGTSSGSAPDIQGMAGKHFMNMLVGICYQTNHRFAYYQDLYEQTRDEKVIEWHSQEFRTDNFTPDYKEVCLYCHKPDATKRCGSCKTVAFCSQECQLNAWPIHKMRCRMSQFVCCCACGTQLKTEDQGVKCQKCPVRFCSSKCRNKIKAYHDSKDCDTFRRLFGETASFPASKQPSSAPGGD